MELKVVAVAGTLLSSLAVVAIAVVGHMLLSLPLVVVATVTEDIVVADAVAVEDKLLQQAKSKVQLSVIFSEFGNLSTYHCKSS